jgi:large subunit ribosomal protein L35
LPKLKLKTHSGAKDRIHLSGTGRFMRRKSHVNNARRKKRQAVKGQFDTTMAVHRSYRRRLRRLLPYGAK